MIFAYMEIVVRDRASDRGCTGGSEGALNVGPPGEILGGFSFVRLPIPGCPPPRPCPLELELSPAGSLLCAGK
jgi:hypothetical protein